MSDEVRAIAGTRRTARELVDGTIRVQIDIEPRFRKAFYDLLGDVDMSVALAPLTPEATQESAREKPNALAQRMHIDGYFRNPALWRALHEEGIYTLKQHKKHVEGMMCAMVGSDCSGQVSMHHCTSAAIPAAGAKLQPDAPNKVPHWYGLPLCHHHHRNWLHQGGATREAKEQLLIKAIALMADRAKAAVKHHIGINSLADLDEQTLEMFEQNIGLSGHGKAA